MTVVAYDIQRLLYGPFSQTPRGIDRIDLGCAQQLLGDTEHGGYGLLPTPVGVRIFPASHVVQYAPWFARAWGESTSAQDDPRYVQVRDFLNGAMRSNEPPRRRSPTLETIRGGARLASMLWTHKWSLGRGLSVLPRNSSYVNIGQIGLMNEKLLTWLPTRPDLMSAFMVHDVIPLSHPDLCSPGNAAQHERAMRNVTKYARAILTPSEAAAAAVREELQRRGASHMRVRAAPLPINDVFRRKGTPDPLLGSRPYFVVCGAIEKRKNHAVLLEVWRRLHQSMKQDTPALVMIGSLGWQSGEVTDFLAQHPELTPHVMICVGLSTAGVQALMAQSRAVLSPSLAEGYGLPPVEALASGAIAVLSDIPSHREGAGEFGIYLDPLDADAWEHTVLRLTADEQDWRSQNAKVAQFRPIDWEIFGARLRQTLSELAG
jgi:glycosyltransferase involved in cell wall biosynthesis